MQLFRGDLRAGRAGLLPLATHGRGQLPGKVGAAVGQHLQDAGLQRGEVRVGRQCRQGLGGELLQVQRDRQRTAGLRTNVLVAVGAAAFVDLGMRIAGSAEAVRVISYVVSGVGCGAGVSDGGASFVVVVVLLVVVVVLLVVLVVWGSVVLLTL